MPIFTGVNLFEITQSGNLVGTASTTSYSDEPTGLSYNPQNNHIFVSDDNSRRIYEIDPGSDGNYGTSDDGVSHFSTSSFGSTDPEGIAYGNGNLFIADGVSNKVFQTSLSGNLLNSFSLGQHGFSDPEGISYNPDNGTLFLVDRSSKGVIEVTTSGELLTKIDISSANPVSPAGIVYAPASNSNSNNLYVVARGIDNDSNPNENDGKVYEFSFQPTSTTSTPTTSGIPGDANGDDEIDIEDYRIWISNYDLSKYGSQYADFNNSGFVDGIDYLIWNKNYSGSSNPPTVTDRPSATPTSIPTGEVFAFPRAEGFGKNSKGGRGGKVIEVTNLNDSGSGSLRACIDSTGPRYCVFRVSGTITVSGVLQIDSPYITIAGQTAPGGGITIRNSSSNGKETFRIDTHDVVIRHIRSRPGPGASGSCCLSAFRILGGENIILDHVSASWAVDENMTHWFAQNDITISWSIFAEGLHDSNHQKGPHSKGYLIGDLATRISSHHNLIAHNNDRHPLYKGGTTGEFINNLVYNWQKSNGATHINDSDGSGPSYLNIIANHYIQGPNTPNVKPITIQTNTHSSTKVYLKDNIGYGRESNSGDDWLIADDFSLSNDTNSPHRTNSYAISPSGIAITPINSVKNTVLENAGSIYGLNSDGTYFLRRDSVDSRVINDVKNKTGKIINNPSEVGGWPNLSSGSTYSDTDHDGISDSWERLFFGNLNRSSSSNSSSDFDNDGYTDLEEFLNRTDPTS
jgi:hypothetical protein